MQEPEEPLFFRGNGATECEDFVNTVNRYAWKSGKSGDSEWAAHFAMSCLAGKALRWAVELDKNIRKDWDLLSAALLREYREDVEDNESGLRSRAVPTPAAAPATLGLIRGRSTLSLAPLSGRIRVDTDLPSIGGYVSRNRNTFGLLKTCSNPDDAIKVHWAPSSSPHLMQILNPPVPEYDHLGVTHYSEDPAYSLFGPNSTASAAFTCLTKPDDQGRVKSLRVSGVRGPVSGKSRAAIWNVLADLTIIPIVKESGCLYAMIPFTWNDDKTVMLVVDCESYTKRFQTRTGSQVKLVFEPV